MSQQDNFSKYFSSLNWFYFFLASYIISGSLRKWILNWVENRLELLLYPLSVEGTRGYILSTSGLFMEIKSGHSSPVMTDIPPISNSRLTIRQNRLLCSSAALSQNNNLLLTVPRKKTGILDDVKSCGWLDAMKSSSPPPAILNKDSISSDASYREWTVCVPLQFHFYY